MWEKIKLWSMMFSVAAATVAVTYCPLLFAQDSTGGSTTVTPAEPTITSLVDTTGLQTSILSEVVSWIGIGLAVGISVYLVFVGWRLMRRFLGR